MRKNKALNECKMFFKLFSDTTRLRIIDLLLEGPLNVQAIHETLNLNQSTVSHQLKLLRDQNVVSANRNGKKIYYNLKDDHVKKIYMMARDHVMECE